MIHSGVRISFRHGRAARRTRRRPARDGFRGRDPARGRAVRPVWDLLLVPERFRILHLLLESVGYDGSTGELELSFYPLGITGLAAEAATIGQPAEVAA